MVYTGVNGISASILKPWVVTIDPRKTFTFREPVRNYAKLAETLAGQGELWAEVIGLPR